MKHSRYCIALSLSLLFLACKEPSLEQKTPPYLEKITTARDSLHVTLSKRKALLNQAHSEIQSLPTDSVKLDLLSEISQAYLSLNDSVQFRATNSELLQLAYDQNFCYMLARANAQLGLFFRNQGKLDSAFYHYHKALENYQQLPLDSTGHFLRGRMLYEMGKIEGIYGDYLGAEANVVAAIKHFRQAGDNQWLYACYTVLGVTAVAIDQPDIALQEFKKAERYLEKAEFPEKETYRWYLENNIALVHFKAADYAKAQAVYTPLLRNKALAAASPELYTKLLTSQAYTYFKGSHNIPQAQALLEQAMELNQRLQLWNDQTRVQQYYAELLVAQGDTLSALRYAEAARALAQSTSNNYSLLKILQLLTRIDPSQSIRYAADYHALSTKLHRQEHIQPKKFARIRLETEDLIAKNRQLTRKYYVQQITTKGLLVLAGAGLVTLALVYCTRCTKRRKIKATKSRVLPS